MLQLYVELAGGNKSVAADMFLTLESRSARSAAIEPLIGRLPKFLQTLYRAIAKVMKQRALDRDKLAHWTWGYSDDLPDALLLQNPKLNAIIDKRAPDRWIRNLSAIYVYKNTDFIKIIENNQNLASICFAYHSIIDNRLGDAQKELLYRELCEAPDLKDILRRQDERAQSQK